MLTLYCKPICPFCIKIMKAAEESGIELELKDISENSTFIGELIERGGKKQVPYLVDTYKEVEMYESDDIINHLRENYVH